MNTIYEPFCLTHLDQMIRWYSQSWHIDSQRKWTSLFIIYRWAVLRWQALIGKRQVAIWKAGLQSPCTKFSIFWYTYPSLPSSGIKWFQEQKAMVYSWSSGWLCLVLMNYCQEIHWSCTKQLYFASSDLVKLHYESVVLKIGPKIHQVQRQYKYRFKAAWNLKTEVKRLRLKAGYINNSLFLRKKIYEIKIVSLIFLIPQE